MEVPIGSCACPVPAVPDPMPKAECAEGLPIAPVPAAAIVPAAMPHAPIEDIPEYNELWPVIWEEGFVIVNLHFPRCKELCEVKEKLVQAGLLSINIET